MAALAALPTLMSTISTVATIAGTAMTAAGTIAAGKAAKVAGDYEAKQLDIKAKEEQAAAQREGEQYQRQKKLALSKVQSLAAGSGFSATDASTLADIGDIEAYGTVQQQMAEYGGTSRRAGLQAQAEAARMEGRNKKRASYYDAASTILGGVSTLADRYSGRARSTSTSGSGGSYRYG